ncbi:MAG: hypothetical protein RL693_133 [Verrucomicrobiota bacterium]|jgi:LysM repeat protein
MHPLYNAVCGIFAVIATTASTVAATPNLAKKTTPQKTAEKAFEEHTVKKGETLWGIAQKHSTSVGEIMDCNRLPNETVREGMTLKIPLRIKNIPINANPTRDVESIKEVANPSKPPPQSSIPNGAVTHTVAENETFYSIGKKYGLTMDSLVAANPTIKPEQLREGMKVVLPKNTPLKSKDTATKIDDGKVKSPATSAAALTIAHKTPEGTVSDKSKSSTKAPAIQSPPPATETKKDIPAPKPVVVSSNPIITKDTESKPKTVVDDGVIRSYIVSAGEDENTISEAFGITKKQLLEYNRLSNSTNLKTGDEIMIPRAVK